MTMRLWKCFENDRATSKEDQKFKEMTAGVGGMKKKKQLLRSWCLDGGKIAKHYRECFQTFTVSHGHSLEGTWLSKKQALDALGPEELQARVMGGSIECRRNKADGRFWEFKLNTEKEEVKTTKEVLWEKARQGALGDEDFDLEAGSQQQQQRHQ